MTKLGLLPDGSTGGVRKVCVQICVKSFQAVRLHLSDPFKENGLRALPGPMGLWVIAAPWLPILGNASSPDGTFP